MCSSSHRITNRCNIKIVAVSPQPSCGVVAFCFHDSQLPFPPLLFRFISSSCYFQTMCFFEQIRWSCGFWKWGRFREQCTTEYRIGETCGLKLVFETNHSDSCCSLCEKIAKKKRRITKMTADIERWKRDGNRPATIERTKSNAAEILASLSRMVEEHNQNAV